MKRSYNYKETYNQWIHDPAIDATLKHELVAIEGQDKEIEDRFYRDLEFGTGGLRGVMGAGTNRMNRYTVGRAAQGFASYINHVAPHRGSVVIAYDSRSQSYEFALETALVMAANQVRAYIFESLRPTPELSFAVRYLRATAGIVITASHNPPEYNGFKAYGQDGGQLLPDVAEQVMRAIALISSPSQILRMERSVAEQAGKLVWIGSSIDQAYLDAVVSASPNYGIVTDSRRGREALKIIYTPLHGAGNLLVRTALAQAGFADVFVVPEQEQPDAQFSTVASPNPEEHAAFAIALKYAEQHEAKLLLATDPDCDRVGVVVRDGAGKYQFLTGNQTGAVIAEYIFSILTGEGKMPVNAVMINTIVSSDLGRAVANHYGVKVMQTLTGFKYIGAKMTEFEKSGEYTFVLGYEESYGYLVGDYARDKDAVVASLLVAEAAAYYQRQGLTLTDLLQQIYARHGYYLENLQARTLKGKDGVAKMSTLMDNWRSNAPKHIAGQPVAQVFDYLQDIHSLPVENVLKFLLQDGSWFCLRPSGTEPKMKMYFAVVGKSEADAKLNLDQLVNDVMQLVDQAI